MKKIICKNKLRADSASQGQQNPGTLLATFPSLQLTAMARDTLTLTGDCSPTSKHLSPLNMTHNVPSVSLASRAPPPQRSRGWSQTQAALQAPFRKLSQTPASETHRPLSWLTAAWDRAVLQDVLALNRELYQRKWS